MKVITTEEENGQVKVMIESVEEGSPMEMEVIVERSEDGEQVIWIDGNEILLGDSLLLEKDVEVFHFGGEGPFIWKGETPVSEREIEVIIERAERDVERAMRQQERELEHMEEHQARITERAMRDAERKAREIERRMVLRADAPAMERALFFPRAGSSQSALESAMLEDGFIESADDYRFSLNGKGTLRINGKKMPDGVYERYKKLYERSSGAALSRGDEIQINKKKD